MGITACPAAVVAAPVECLWELFSDLTRYDEWWDARTERVVPKGKVAPGQTLYGKTAAFGRNWEVTLRVEAVHPEKHQIRLHVRLPLGMVNDATFTGTAVDAATSRVQFG